MMPPPGTRVLIVEDEAIIAMTAEDMIEDIRCVVAGVATNLAEAIAQVEAGDFDVVLLDINLNGITSVAVAELLTERSLPFVFTTGYGSGWPAADFAHAPVVAKPYRADQIGAAIGKVLGQ